MQADAASRRDLIEALGRMENNRCISEQWADFRKQTVWFYTPGSACIAERRSDNTSYQ